MAQALGATANPPFDGFMHMKRGAALVVVVGNGRERDTNVFNGNGWRMRVVKGTSTVSGTSEVRTR